MTILQLMDDYRARFFSACSDCPWEEDLTHEKVADCPSLTCPLCGGIRLAVETEISRKNDQGVFMPLQRTFKRYGRVRYMSAEEDD